MPEPRYQPAGTMAGVRQDFGGPVTDIPPIDTGDNLQGKFQQALPILGALGLAVLPALIASKLGRRRYESAPGAGSWQAPMKQPSAGQALLLNAPGALGQYLQAQQAEQGSGAKLDLELEKLDVAKSRVAATRESTAQRESASKRTRRTAQERMGMEENLGVLRANIKNLREFGILQEDDPTSTMAENVIDQPQRYSGVTLQAAEDWIRTGSPESSKALHDSMTKDFQLKAKGKGGARGAASKELTPMQRLKVLADVGFDPGPDVDKLTPEQRGDIIDTAQKRREETDQAELLRLLSAGTTALDIAGKDVGPISDRLEQVAGKLIAPPAAKSAPAGPAGPAGQLGAMATGVPAELTGQFSQGAPEPRPVTRTPEEHSLMKASILRRKAEIKKEYGDRATFADDLLNAGYDPAGLAEELDAIFGKGK